MHRTESPDNVANKYDETFPGTIIGGPAMNALQEEVAGAVEDSGQTIRTQATDLVALYKGQLTEAIKTLPFQNPEDVTITLTSGVATALTPTKVQAFLRVERPGGGLSTPGEELSLPNDVAYLGRLVTIRNGTNVFIQIKDRRGHISLIGSQTAEQFYCFTDDGANYDWSPLSGIYSGKFSASYRLDDPATTLTAQDFYWTKKGYFCTIALPAYDASSIGTVNPGNISRLTLPAHLVGFNANRANMSVQDLATGVDFMVIASVTATELAIPGMVDSDNGFNQQVIQYMGGSVLMTS